MLGRVVGMAPVTAGCSSAAAAHGPVDPVAAPYLLFAVNGSLRNSRLCHFLTGGHLILSEVTYFKSGNNSMLMITQISESYRPPPETIRLKSCPTHLGKSFELESLAVMTIRVNSYIKSE